MCVQKRWTGRSAATDNKYLSTALYTTIIVLKWITSSETKMDQCLVAVLSKGHDSEMQADAEDVCNTLQQAGKCTGRLVCSMLGGVPRLKDANVATHCAIAVQFVVCVSQHQVWQACML